MPRVEAVPVLPSGQALPGDIKPPCSHLHAQGSGIYPAVMLIVDLNLARVVQHLPLQFYAFAYTRVYQA